MSFGPDVRLNSQHMAPARNHDFSQHTTAASSPAPSIVKADIERDAEKNEDRSFDADSAQNQLDSEKKEDLENAAKEAPVPATFGPMHPSQFPDGGVEAWLVVFGAFIGLIVSFGWINCKYHRRLWGFLPLPGCEDW